MRLNKYIAHAGICSRREADALIAAGSVSVNGRVVTEMGYQVMPGDTVNYGGEVLRSEHLRYFLLNKPKGFITTTDDPQERRTVMMLMDGCCPERIYPVGRLDRATTGLLLFTNDGELARKLTHPSTRVYKIYQVELNKPVTRDDMRRLLEGIELEDGPMNVDDIQYVGNGADKRIVGVELHSGRNRIVRRLFESLGYEVHKLDRVVFAGLTKKDLPRGRWRELTEREVGYLKMI
ncbi:MAG: rRNA pseudouridine synthase [Bacteroidales bacterium]|nr:rRNA pseudouridine synthase [Bacteroidales bacterium]